MKKILIVTPKFPYPSYGACEQDRAAGIEMFVNSGYRVYVITKVYADEYKKNVHEVAEKLRITIVPVTYKYLFSLSWREKMIKAFLRLIQPWYWDGAAFEYSDPEMRAEVKKALDSFQPDVVWFDYTYLWPLYSLVRKKKIPIITRSINFEPIHFLEEDGRSALHYFKSLLKLVTEYIVSRLSDVICAITPDEDALYKKIGARRTVVLPLRSLPNCFIKLAEVHEHTPLDVFFAGSTYNVAHNRKALEFLLASVIPKVQQQFPNKFIFHIFGGKVPPEFNIYFVDGVNKHDYVTRDKFEELMSSMDIAVMPSLYGAGMQQKIFEPLARGFPTITSSRGLAGYPFKADEHLLLARSADEFVVRLGELGDANLRRRLGHAARTLALNLFSEESITHILRQAVSFANTIVS